MPGGPVPMLACAALPRARAVELHEHELARHVAAQRWLLDVAARTARTDPRSGVSA